MTELGRLAALPPESVPALAALAHEVRLAWCGPEVEVEGILSAKTGGCPEDCHFCSQSARFESPVKATPFLDPGELTRAAEEPARLGESDAHRLELLGQLRDVEPAEVPLNFLNPRPGTPLGERTLVEPLEAIRWIALFRLALPDVILRYAGGREVTLRDLQAMGMTSGINALIVGNYLTTLGRAPDEDLRMLEDLRMPVGVLSKVL